MLWYIKIVVRRLFIQDFSERFYINNKDRFCDYCGLYIDIKDIDIIIELHSTCWKYYRSDGKLYKMPNWW